MYISDLHDFGADTPDVAKEFIEQKRKEQIKKEIEQLVDDEFDRMEEYCGEFISQAAADRARRFLEKVLRGDKDAAMELLGSSNNGDRYRVTGCDSGKPWAHLIHGSLFETDGIRLRREIVAANTDLIASERIADLESIVDGLSQQVRQLTADLEACRDRLVH